MMYLLLYRTPNYVTLWRYGNCLKNPRNSKFCLISQTCARPRTLVRTVERANPSAMAINAYVQPGTKEDTVNKVALST